MSLHEALLYRKQPKNKAKYHDYYMFLNIEDSALFKLYIEEKKIKLQSPNPNPTTKNPQQLNLTHNKPKPNNKTAITNTKQKDAFPK